MASAVASPTVRSPQAAQGVRNGPSSSAKIAPSSAFLGAGLKKSRIAAAFPPSCAKRSVVRAVEDETKQGKKDRWAGLAYDTSDDQQDITRGKGTVDALFQGAVGMGTQHAVMSSHEYLSTAQRNYSMDNIKDGFYIAPAFMDKLVVHLAKNFMNLPNIKVPLILGIWGGKGQGKSFQCELVFSKLGINPITMSAGELESGNAGEPAKLLRQRYREAADVIQKKGKMCALFINDLDAGAGRMGDTTQYTVNNQMVNATLMNIADNPTNVQMPGVYNKEEIPRVPIIVTGNDFSTLYAPLIRDGRMEKFYWAPTREDRVGVCKGIFKTDDVPDSHIVKLVDTFPGQSIDFFGALRARVYDDEVRKWVSETGVESMGKKLVNSKEGPPTFKKPAMTVEKLIEYGFMLVSEQENVQRVQLAERYMREAALGDANEDEDIKDFLRGKVNEAPEASISPEEIADKIGVEGMDSLKMEENPVAIHAIIDEMKTVPSPQEVEKPKVVEDEERSIGDSTTPKSTEDHVMQPPAAHNIPVASKNETQSAGEAPSEEPEDRELTRDVLNDAFRSLASSIVSFLKR